MAPHLTEQNLSDAYRDALMEALQRRMDATGLTPETAASPTGEPVSVALNDVGEIVLTDLHVLVAQADEIASLRDRVAALEDLLSGTKGGHD